MQNSIGDATLTLNSVDSSIIHDVSNGPNVLSTGWPRATLVCRPNSHPFQVRIRKNINGRGKSKTNYYPRNVAHYEFQTIYFFIRNELYN